MLFRSLAAHAALAGARTEVIREIMGSVTTAEALARMSEEKLLEPAMKTIMAKMEDHLEKRAGDSLEIGAVMFSPKYGILGMTRKAVKLSEEVKK